MKRKIIFIMDRYKISNFLDVGSIEYKGKKILFEIILYQLNVVGSNMMMMKRVFDKENFILLWSLNVC